MSKKILTAIAIVAVLTWGTAAFSLDSGHEGHGVKSEAAEKEGTEHTATTDTYSHQLVVDGIRGEFEVMSLESMNMKDPEGATHHIMVKLYHDKMDHQIKEAVGKIKVIGPDKNEQVAELKNYSGIFAGNFVFDTTGKYGVICLVKVGEEKHAFKFWYPHSM